MALNQVTLQGIVPNNDKFQIDVRFGDDGNVSVLRAPMAVRRNWKPKDEQYYASDIIWITAFGHTANFMNTYLKKGEPFVITGHLVTSTFEKDGKNITRTDVIVDNYMFIDGARSGGSDDSNFENFADDTKAEASGDNDILGLGL